MLLNLKEEIQKIIKEKNLDPSLLKNKDFKDEKVVENIQAEILDIVLQEAVQLHEDNVFEFNTSDRPVEEIVGEQKAIVDEEREVIESHRPGDIDWTGYSSLL